MRELLGVVNARGAARGYLVSTGGFTTGAVEFAKDNGLVLLDADQLAALANSLAPGRSKAFAAGGSARRWPTPAALGPWMSLNVSSSTPRFHMKPPMSPARLLLVGAGWGLAGGFMFILFLAIWAFTSRAAIPIALAVSVSAVAIGLGVKFARDDDLERTPSCASCHHQSRSHRLEPFSPYRLRLRCRDCLQCDNVLPDVGVDSGERVAPLLYVMPPADGIVRIERVAAKGPEVVTTMSVNKHRAPILLTDASGTRGVSRYRFEFSPTQPATKVETATHNVSIRVPQAPSTTIAATTATEQRCPKCRRRLRLSRNWQDGRGYWACWTCGFSKELGE